MTISVVALIAVHAALAQSSAPAACNAQANLWTPSEIVWSVPWDERGPSPYSIAASATTIYIFTENSVLLAGMDSLRDGEMIGLALPRYGKGGAHVIATPPGHHRIRLPKIAVDDSGTLHMVWMEVLNTTGPDGDARMVTVWVAHYQNDSWKIEKLTQSQNIWWTPTGVSDIVHTANGDLHLVAPDFLPAFLYVTRRAGRWMAMEVPVRMGAAYTGLAARHDSVFVGLVGPTPEPGDVNSIWFAVSPDAGRSWDPPVLVSRSRQLAGRELRIAPEESGPISVVWAQKDAVTQSLGRVVRIATSRDYGRTWSAPSTLKPTTSRVYLVEVAARAPGVVDAFFSGDEALTLARVCGRTWGKPYLLKDTVPSAGPAVMLVERGQHPQIFWDGPALDSALPPTRYWLRSTMR